MAWNDKGGGPWGSPPGGGEPRRPPSNDRGGPSPNKGPNDFEAMLRQIQDWLGRFPGLGGGGLPGQLPPGVQMPDLSKLQDPKKGK